MEVQLQMPNIFQQNLFALIKKMRGSPIKSIALTTDTSILTVWANDFNYESIFTRQIEAFSGILGLSIGLSTSGQSKNVLDGLNYSKKIGLKTILICGDQKINDKNIDITIKIPSKSTSTIQTVTQVLYHSICEVLEES